jgi:heme exporter protein A
MKSHASHTATMLEADNLAAVRGHTRLFANIALRVDARETLFVTGPNGSGKTTLLRILAGLSAPAAGVIRWMGNVVAPLDACVRDEVAFAGHLPALKDELTAIENLVALVTLGGITVTTEQAFVALDRVALSRQRLLPARVLSQGQRRRIGLARLTLVKKPLWILDEPTTGLDSDGIALLTSLLRQHLDANGCAVVATHQPLSVPRFASLALA